MCLRYGGFMKGFSCGRDDWEIDIGKKNRVLGIPFNNYQTLHFTIMENKKGRRRGVDKAERDVGEDIRMEIAVLGWKMDHLSI